MVYIVAVPKYIHKRHQNQLQKRRLNHSNDVPQTEEQIDNIFDMFDLDPSQLTLEIRRSVDLIKENRFTLTRQEAEDILQKV